jgi:hypothetical protein
MHKIILYTFVNISIIFTRFLLSETKIHPNELHNNVFFKLKFQTFIHLSLSPISILFMCFYVTVYNKKK